MNAKVLSVLVNSLAPISSKHLLRGRNMRKNCALDEDGPLLVDVLVALAAVALNELFTFIVQAVSF